MTRKFRQIFVTFLSTSLFFFAAPSIAEEDKEQGAGPSPFTECGIGAQLFPNTHWAAVTSNVIWDVGTTAVISATASPETCNSKSAQAAQFILDTYESVVEETAEGNGDHLVALLQIYGCSTESHANIVSAIRSNVGATVSSADYADMSRLQKSEAYFNVIDTEVQSSSAGHCAA